MKKTVFLCSLLLMGFVSAAQQQHVVLSCDYSNAKYGSEDTLFFVPARCMVTGKRLTTEMLRNLNFLAQHANKDTSCHILVAAHVVNDADKRALQVLEQRVIVYLQERIKKNNKRVYSLRGHHDMTNIYRAQLVRDIPQENCIRFDIESYVKHGIPPPIE